jgi:hypothetical protein
VDRQLTEEIDVEAADEEISSRVILELLEDLQEPTDPGWLEVIWGDAGSGGHG